MAAAIRCKFAGLSRQIVNSNLFRAFTETPVSRISFHLSAHFNAVGQEIKMPSLSPTMTEGVIVKWLKNEGDVIAPGDVLCEIQTDKAVMSFETEEEGILAKILVGENVKDIKVGTSIALMVAEGEDWKTVEVSSSTDAATTSQVASELSEGGNGASISMPSLSPTMTAGTIVKWLKNEGDTISPGDVLCEIQTDKAVMSFETEEEGILAKIIVAEGTSDVKVGSLIAVMVAEGENWQDVIIPSATGEPVKAESTTSSATSPATTTSHGPTSYGLTNFGPAVRGLLELYQLDSSQITPSGKNEKILKSDVLQYINDKKLQPKPPLPVPLPGKKIKQEFSTAAPILLRPVIEKFIDIELSSMRKTIAKRLTESKTTIPHAYATVDCDIDLLLSFRKQLKSAGVAVSVNDFVIKAVALALKECPLVNCLYVKDQTVSAPSIDVSVAVATDSGLITPIVKNANVKTIDEISAEVKELAKRARDGKLQLHEFQGGSFTISNLGMFGITEFSAIINPPQCGILAVGGGQPYIDIN